MEDLTTEIMKIIVPAVTTVVGILVAWGLAELRKYVKTKTGNEAAVQAFDTVADLVQSSVVSINQTLRKTFEDGKMSQAEKVELKKAAKSMVLNQIPAATKKVLDANLNDLDAYVDKRIEQTVHYEGRAKKYEQGV